MNLNLLGKNALVGGSSKGIGWASAIELALMGANVTLVARSEETLRQKVALLANNGHQNHDFLVLDYQNLKEVESKISALRKNYHILVNNTGGPAGGNMMEESTEKFEVVFRQHVIVNQILVQAFVPFMQSEGFGRIVNIISVSVKQPIIGLGVSNTIRWAVASWAKTLSKEITGNGITVNNVLPGYTLTDRLIEVNKTRAESLKISVNDLEKQLLVNVPSGKFATAEEVAAAVAFLCSPSAGAINGVNIPVDGGLSATL